MLPLDEQITGRSKAGLQLLLGAVGVVLLIGCVNITNLLLARSTMRRREIAVSSAIGASSARLLRQSLAETTTLAAAGTVVGLVLAHVVLQTVLAYAPVDLPRMDEVRLDVRIFGFMAVLAAITSVACGLLPAWHFARTDPQDAMKSVSRSATSGRAAGRLRSASGRVRSSAERNLPRAAGLLLHSFVRLMGSIPASEASVWSRWIIAPGCPLSERARSAGSSTGRCCSEVSALPGVVSAGITNGLPVTAHGGNSTIHVEGVTLPEIERPLADIRNVNPDFFPTMGIALRSGSFLSESDRDGRTAVISASMAERAWPGQQPLGKRFRIGEPAVAAVRGRRRRWGRSRCEP